MELKYPNSNVDFIVGPAFFLGDFDIYDREETLGVSLNEFDPNDTKQLEQLLDLYFFNGGRVVGLTAGHKKELIRVLSCALASEDFDFLKLVTPDREPDDYFMLPDSWDIKNPRDFFKSIFDITLERWKNEV